MRPIRTLLSLVIIVVHVGTIALFYRNRPSPLEFKKRLVVRAQRPPKITPQPKVPAAPVKPVAAPIEKKRPPPPKPKPKPKPAPAKKPTPAPKAKPQPAPTKKPTPAPKPKQQEAVIPQNLLSQLEESIAKIEQKDHKVITKSSLEVPTLEVASKVAYSESDVGFVQKLVECLHRSLALPDHGEVTIELTLTSMGMVSKLSVVKAASVKNRDYLEKHLPQVVFPPLEGADAKQLEKKFVLTFCNEI